jgi:hypothetical protein
MGKIRGANSYVSNSDDREYATIGECLNAIANRIKEQGCKDDYFAALKFTEHAPILISGTDEPAQPPAAPPQQAVAELCASAPQLCAAELIALRSDLAASRESEARLLAALRVLLPLAVAGLSQAPDHDGIVNCEALAQARAAIAQVEGRAQ